MLNCPICGKLYAYESKICKACEDYAIRSGLTSKKVLFTTTYPFRNLQHFKKVEHHEYRIEQPLDYGWNCNVSSKTQVDMGKEFCFNSNELLEIPLDKRVNPTLYFE